MANPPVQRKYKMSDSGQVGDQVVAPSFPRSKRNISARERYSGGVRIGM